MGVGGGPFGYVRALVSTASTAPRPMPSQKHDVPEGRNHERRETGVLERFRHQVPRQGRERASDAQRERATVLMVTHGRAQDEYVGDQRNKNEPEV